MEGCPSFKGAGGFGHLPFFTFQVGRPTTTIISMTERTLIVPGVYTHFEDVEVIIASRKPDKVVFLGDYFSWGNSAQSNIETAKWLHESLKDTSRLHLIGDQDIGLSHALPVPALCQDPDTPAAVNSVMTELDWAFMHIHAWLGKYLLTHAGISVSLLPRSLRRAGPADLFYFLKDSEEEAWDEMLAGNTHWLHKAVWGSQPLIKFKSLPLMPQIFGHFKFREPLRLSSAGVDNVCIGTFHTEFVGPAYCGWYDGKQLQIISSLAEELKPA